MTNDECLAQLRETAGSGQAMEAIRTGLAVLYARGAAPEELLRFCADTLHQYALRQPAPDYWQ